MAPRKQKGATGGLTLAWFGYPHCGPFNQISINEAKGLDGVCQRHDLEYGRIGKRAYWQFNAADQRFIDEAHQISGPASTLVKNIFAIKKLLLPHDDKSLRLYEHQKLTRQRQLSAKALHEHNTRNRPTINDWMTSRRAGRAKWAKIAAIKKNVAAILAHLAPAANDDMWSSSGAICSQMSGDC